MVETTQASNRRVKGSRGPVDVSSFVDDVDAALRAFAEDVSYAVSMAGAAVAIHRKRKVWDARRALRDAERAAHAECHDAAPFRCRATGPCGVGDCKYAHGEMTLLDVPATPGATKRPQAAAPGPYSMDGAVAALVALRSSQG